MKPLPFPKWVSILLVWGLGFGQKQIVCPAALWSYLHIQRAPGPFESFIGTLNLAPHPSELALPLNSTKKLRAGWCKYTLLSPVTGCALVLTVQTCYKSLSVLYYGLLKDSLTFLSRRVLNFHVEVGLEIWVVALKSCATDCCPERSGKLTQVHMGQPSIKWRY